ncbi:Smr/MutS family protein [Yoonia sp. MH D7]
MRRPRHLSAEERALWDRVADTARPLEPARPVEPAHVTKPVSRPVVREVDPIQHFMMGEKAKHGRANDILPSMAARLTHAPVQMDNKAYGKMTRGKLKPEARIDLHGLTMAEAHPDLIAFILGSHAIGRRLVLVITGKGKLRDDGGRLGILRHQVPQWMALPPLSQAILQVTPAHLNHGGHGAYYVYLRRSR